MISILHPQTIPNDFDRKKELFFFLRISFLINHDEEYALPNRKYPLNLSFHLDMLKKPLQLRVPLNHNLNN